MFAGFAVAGGVVGGARDQADGRSQSIRAHEQQSARPVVGAASPIGAADVARNTLGANGSRKEPKGQFVSVRPSTGLVAMAG